MRDVQVGATGGRARGTSGSASVCLFALGSFDAGIYLAEVVTDGVRYTAMLESAAGLLFASWVAGAVHLARIRKAVAQES
ncbi:hypothetical protein [Streptomyces sp. NPDC005573]|uniref:hypothetical protein n=1 Tax=Streptomyces sp. NPDC005573 TaxID=3156890 RepID=UPI0033AF860E